MASIETIQSSDSASMPQRLRCCFIDLPRSRFCSTEEDLHMSLINTKVKPFKAQAFHNGKFITVSEADLKGKWSAVVFYPADFTFVCPTELVDLDDLYNDFKNIDVELYSVS